MSEDFLFTDGMNPSALLDILDEDGADVNTSFDVDKILAKFIEPTLKKCKYDHDRWAKSILKIKLNKQSVPISLKRLHSIMSGGCKIIEMANGQIKIIPNSWKYNNEILFVLNIFFDRLTIGNNVTGCSTWAPKQQPNCNIEFVNLLNCLFKEQEYEFEKLLHFFKQNTIGKYKLDSELKNSQLLQQIINKFTSKTFQ